MLDLSRSGARAACSVLLAAAVVGCQFPASATDATSAHGVPALAAGPAASGARAEAHVRYLADDALAGRDTGTTESLQAAEYIAQHLRAAGVAPAGDDGSFFQDIGWVGYALDAPPRVVLVHSDGQASTLQHGVDFMLSSGPPTRQQFVIERVSDLGELEADDPGRQARALLLDGGNPQATFALRRGFDPQAVPDVQLVLLAGPEKPGKPRPLPQRLVGQPGRPVMLWLRGEALAAVRAGQVAHVELELGGGETVAAVNVVGRLEGVGTPERPELADEVIVFSAHYDHVGSSRPDPAEDTEGVPDLIYNGADDDASGVATLLELARALAAGPAPARTLVFLAVTGEEKGLLGTHFYLDQPALPLDETVCNVNFEMLGMPDSLAGGPGYLFLTGFERTNLGPTWAARGLPIVIDPRPEQNYFARSDNYPFAVRGIVAQTLSSGGDNPHYHQVTDEADTLDFDHMRQVIATVGQAVAPLVDGTLDPQWAPDGQP